MQPADDSRFFKLRGKTWIAMSKIDRERMIEQCFQFWRERGFPYDQLTPDQMASDFGGVLRTNTSHLWTKEGLAASTAGLRLANSFHPEMWSVRCKRAHSPAERFYCDISLRRVLRRALTIWPGLYSINPTNLRSMLRTFSKTTRVSNFRPVVAKAVIERYFEKRGISILPDATSTSQLTQIKGFSLG